MSSGQMPADFLLHPPAPQGESASIPEMIHSAATMAGVPVDIATRLVKQESSFNPKAKSGVGAMGLTQLMPGTAKQMGVTDPWNPADNLAGGLKYLAQMKEQFGTWGHALAAYNWGPGNVAEWVKKGANMADLPGETRAYVHAIAPDEAVALAAAPKKKSNLELLDRRVSGGGEHPNDFLKSNDAGEHPDNFLKTRADATPDPTPRRFLRRRTRWTRRATRRKWAASM